MSGRCNDDVLLRCLGHLLSLHGRGSRLHLLDCLLLRLGNLGRLLHGSDSLLGHLDRLGLLRDRSSRSDFLLLRHRLDLCGRGGDWLLLHLLVRLIIEGHLQAVSQRLEVADANIELVEVLDRQILVRSLFLLVGRVNKFVVVRARLDLV